MSNEVLQQTLSILEELVACDTQNPPRDIGEDGALVSCLVDQLPGFDIEVTDLGNGCVNVLARRGKPKTVCNFHLDTVPANENWTLDPLRLTVADGRAYGLGACDIKGAAAAMISAANRTDGPVAMLFSSDEEAGPGACVPGFLASEHGFSRALVAEPTLARAVCAHRGIATARLAFSGVPGHGSAERALDDSAIHRAVQWSTAALDWIRGEKGVAFENLQGLRMNIGTISGGIKNNMIAARAELSFGMRTLPGQDGLAMLEKLAGVSANYAPAEWQPQFIGPAFPDAARGDEGLAASRALAEALGLQVGPAVDFWTEAALFGQAGLDTLVYGSGDIAQAHTADEWVALEQLIEVSQTYERLISDGLL